MEQQRFTNASARPRPLSADFAACPLVTCKESVLYSMLPSVVQSRLPRIPSLRRSVSMYGVARRKLYLSKSTPTSRPNTPPDEYDTAITLKAIAADGKRSEISQYYAEVSSEEEDQRGRLGGRGSTTKNPTVTEDKSGIGWKYAGQGTPCAYYSLPVDANARRTGLNLLSLSTEESSNISRGAVYGNASFARQLYIHALTYLLRGLPPDMTTDEQLSIRSALPCNIVSTLHEEAVGQLTPPSTSDGKFSTLHHHRHPPPPSLLHRALASAIIQLILLISFLLPYIRLVLQRIYDYERRNHIAERVLAGSIDTVDGLSRRGWGVSAAVWGAGLSDFFGWVLEELGSGVRDGVGQGLQRVRKTAEPDRDGDGAVSLW